MKNHLKFALTTLLLIYVSCNTINAQFGAIEFVESVHDFGQVKEELGPVAYEFKFKNTGTAPLIIKDVQASCGCTTPTYTKDPVAPGKTGIIKAQYDPANRPGIFDKTLTITANTDPGMNFLKIKGFVIAKIKTIEDEYPDTVGNLRMTSRFLNVGSVSTKMPVIKEFKVYNESPNSLTFQAPISLAPHLKFEISPKILPSKSVATIKITYDGKLKNDFGYVFDNFILPTNDKKNPRKEISVVAIVSEDFSTLTPEQKATAPKATVTKDTQELGEITAGENKEIEFEIINTGKSDLIIKKIKSTCNCISATASATTAKVGEAIKIKAIFNTTGRKGKEYKNVYVYTNDYSNPEIVLNINANIVVQ